MFKNGHLNSVEYSNRSSDKVLYEGVVCTMYVDLLRCEHCLVDTLWLVFLKSTSYCAGVNKIHTIKAQNCHYSKSFYSLTFNLLS